MIPKLYFYMDHGDWDGDAHYAQAAQELYDNLSARGLDADHVQYRVFPFANHTEADWARRAYIPLQYLLK